MPGGRVPGYLGRVLGVGGEPVGTCFQAREGLLVTAWHVLENVGVGSTVRVDPLAGGPAFEATVLRTNELHDLAVLATSGYLEGSSGPLVATDHVPVGEEVVVTGVAKVEDPGHQYRYLDAPGLWAGGTTRDEEVPLGRLRSADVVPGMSGAPVVRRSDGAVAGVVSGRYNSTDGWLATSVWVARTEDLLPLLPGELSVQALALAGMPIDLVLSVSATEVHLQGLGIDVVGAHRGLTPGLENAVNDLRRHRAAMDGTRALTSTAMPSGGVREAGRLLAESLLPAEVTTALRSALAQAEAQHVVVRLGVEIEGPLSALPWEALELPGSGRPLCLAPSVNLYRRSTAPTAGVALGAPLQVVVAIASASGPGAGRVLDYEDELRSVVRAVRSARACDAVVRVVPFATTTALRRELSERPAHILHISGHGAPGHLVLEDEDGSAREIGPDDFVDEAVPPGRMPPVVSLATCYSDVGSALGEPSFAARLIERGARAVVATETSVSDLYATRLFARLYGELAAAGAPELLSALADARRAVQAELTRSELEREKQIAALDEWASVSVVSRLPEIVVLDRSAPAVPPAPVRTRVTIGGLVRSVGDFVGRRSEQRRWPAQLISTGLAGIVVHGIGGVGKTTLAQEVVERVVELDPSRIVVALSGQLNVDGLLSAVATRARQRALVEGAAGHVAQALGIVARSDATWQDRFAVLQDHVLGALRLLIVLDNFEDNAALTPQGYEVRDPALGQILADWVSGPGESRLLITSRHPFKLPGGCENRLEYHQLGPLSFAETRKLAWSLPALDRLGPDELEELWRMVGGHPRSLEYLDALLTGKGRYPDITSRLRAALEAKLGTQRATALLADGTSFDQALAETVTLAADDVLLDGLLSQLGHEAVALVVGVSVYREPVDLNAVLFQVGIEDPEVARRGMDHESADQQWAQILTEAGYDLEHPPHPAALSAELSEAAAALLAAQEPFPSFRAPAGLGAVVDAAVESTLLSIDPGPGVAARPTRFFVHRWTATEIERRWRDRDAIGDIIEAHKRAASYWQWRFREWPEPPRFKVQDLLEAWYHLITAGNNEEANRLTETLCVVLNRWGAWDQEEALVRDTLSRMEPTSSSAARWFHELGVIAQERGDYDEAGRRYQQSLEIKESLGDEAGMATDYHNLGTLAQLQGDYREAERHYQQSLEIKKRLGNEAGIAASSAQLATLAQLRGDYDEAASRYKQSLDVFERLGDEFNVGLSYAQLGTLAQLRGSDDEAAAHYNQSVGIFKRLGAQPRLASVYRKLGTLAQRRGDYDKAARRYQQSLDISEGLGDLGGMADGYGDLGTIAQACRDYDEAARRYQQALEIKERLGDQAGIAAACGLLGTLAQARGDHDEAARRYQQCLDISERLGEMAGTAAAHGALGALAQDRGDYDEAERRYKQSLDIFERLGDQAGISKSFHQLGIIAQLRGD
jgi:tetratricopeptide (TPR) repeat protein